MTTAADGTRDWTNPNNAKVEDGVFTMADFSSGTDDFTYRLQASNFGFSIPNGSTIDGIKLEWKASDVNDLNFLQNFFQVLEKNGAPGIGYTADGGNENSALTNTLVFYSAGGATDKWGTTWTTSDINGSGFLASITVSNNSVPDPSDIANVDVIKVTVFYTDAAGNKKHIIN